MKYLAFAAFALILFASPFTANAAETRCRGDAIREKPPVPNYPHHLRNVVWRNTRAMCLAELSRKTKSPVASDTPSTQSPPSAGGSPPRSYLHQNKQFQLTSCLLS